MLKSKNSNKKVAAIATIATAILLVFAIWILIVSSVVFSVLKAKHNSKNNDEIAPPDITYGIVDSIDNYLVPQDALVNVRDYRSKLSSDMTNQYYATASPNIMLTSGAQKALDKMLVAFYNMNRAKIVTDISLTACNIPTITNPSDDGLSFVLQTFNDKSVANDATYSWIFNNAAKYGFIYKNNAFTYVGVAHATIMSQNNVTDINAYVSLLKNGAIKTNVTDGVNSKAGNYTVYFIENGAAFSVPSNYSYTAQATSDGYIITVDMSRVIG